MSLQFHHDLFGSSRIAYRLISFLLMQLLCVTVSSFGDPSHGKVDFDPSVGLADAGLTKKKKVIVPSYTRHIKTMREVCRALSIDGRLEDFQRVVGTQPTFSPECPTCRPFFRTWFSSCQIKGVGNLKIQPPSEETAVPAVVPTAGSQATGGAESSGAASPPPAVSPTAVESTPEKKVEEADDPSEPDDGDEEENGVEPKPSPTPRPIGPERDPNIVVLDLVSRLFQSLAEGEGADLSLQAVDLLVHDLREPSGKSDSARAYFITVTEFMLAPFQTVREEVAQASPRSQESAPNSAVDDMFEF